MKEGETSLAAERKWKAPGPAQPCRQLPAGSPEKAWRIVNTPAIVMLMGFKLTQASIKIGRAMSEDLGSRAPSFILKLPRPL